MELKYYIIRRILLFLVVVFGVLTLVFAISHVIPADPVAALIGERATPEMIDAARRKYGFDRPLHEQYFSYLIGFFLRGDLGNTLRTGVPISQAVGKFFPASFQLIILSMAMAVVISIPSALMSAYKQNTLIDHFVRVFSLIGQSMPRFWLALVLLWLLSFKIPIFPLAGEIDIYLPRVPKVTGAIIIDGLLAGDLEVAWSGVKHAILPSFVLGFFAAGWITRITRASLLEVMRLGYVRMARAKGLMDRVILYRHVLRNAMLPSITVIGMSVGYSIGASTLVEAVFAYPGLGFYALDSIQRFDYFAVMGVAVVTGLTFAISNLVVDITYAFLDPRVRIG